MREESRREGGWEDRKRERNAGMELAREGVWKERKERGRKEENGRECGREYDRVSGRVVRRWDGWREGRWDGGRGGRQGGRGGERMKRKDGGRDGRKLGRMQEGTKSERVGGMQGGTMRVRDLILLKTRFYSAAKESSTSRGPVGRSAISVRLQRSCIDLQFNIVNIHLMLVIHMDVFMLLKSRMFRYIECHMANIFIFYKTCL